MLLFRAHIEFIRHEFEPTPVPLAPIPETSLITIVRHDFDQTVAEIFAPDKSTVENLIRKYITPLEPLTEYNILRVYVLV